MPYKDPDKQREFQRARNAEIRAAFFADKSCVDCGATTGLELDHVDQAAKESHRIWSWSTARRAAEIAKCVVRCKSCHQKRHGLERQRHGAGGYKRGCRCSVCCAWKSAANARYQERKAA